MTARQELAWYDVTTNPMADKLADLQNRRQQAYNAGSQRAVERQHEKGKLLAQIGRAHV